MHEYFLIGFGMLLWEILTTFIQTNHTPSSRQFWRVVYNGFVCKESGWMVSIVVGFDDEFLEAFVNKTYHVDWWEYIMIGFFFDILVKRFTKPK